MCMWEVCGYVCGCVYGVDMIPVSVSITFSYCCCSTETLKKSHRLIKTNKRKQAKHLCLLHQRCRLLAGWASCMTWRPRVYWQSLARLEGHREQRDL